MKTLFIMSDTHGNLSAMEKLIPIMRESDYVIHLGDYAKDRSILPPEIYDKFYFVLGNCDGGGEDLVLEIDGVKVLLTHGDRYGVKNSLYKLFLHGKEIGANLVLYGHTHSAEITEEEGITFINPGTMSIYSNKSYCYAVIHDKKITAKIVDI